VRRMRTGRARWVMLSPFDWVSWRQSYRRRTYVTGLCIGGIGDLTVLVSTVHNSFPLFIQPTSPPSILHSTCSSPVLKAIRSYDWNRFFGRENVPNWLVIRYQYSAIVNSFRQREETRKLSTRNLTAPDRRYSRAA